MKFTAKKSYQHSNCKGLATITLLVEASPERLHLNEINVLTRFIQISMSSDFRQATGVSYQDALEKFTQFALKRHQVKSQPNRNYQSKSS